MQASGAKGLSLVELLSACPTYWRMTPGESMEWIENEMSQVFPLGCLKNDWLGVPYEPPVYQDHR
jgi:2-oxoglutarate ferredoxin oxidoreductase subunit beta